MKERKKVKETFVMRVLHNIHHHHITGHTVLVNTYRSSANQQMQNYRLKIIKIEYLY